MFILNVTTLKLLPNIISKAKMSTLITFNERWLEVLARNKARKSTKIEKQKQKIPHKYWEKKVKLPLSAGDILIYIDTPKESTKMLITNLVGIIMEFSKYEG